MPAGSVRAVLFAYLDELPPGRYGLWPLTDALNLRTNKRTMPHQVKAYCKDYADRAGAEFRCVLPRNSIYEYVPGVKISGALEGKE